MASTLKPKVLIHSIIFKLCKQNVRIIIYRWQAHRGLCWDCADSKLVNVRIYLCTPFPSISSIVICCCAFPGIDISLLHSCSVLSSRTRSVADTFLLSNPQTYAYLSFVVICITSTPSCIFLCRTFWGRPRAPLHYPGQHSWSWNFTSSTQA